MTPSVTDTPPTRHRVIPETPRPTMAKADLRKAEPGALLIGRALQRAASLLGWSLKELAGAVGRDPRQVARWIAGQERAPLDLLWDVETLRQPLVIALAERCDGCDVVTEIRVRRIA
jgi:hypothetical protein